MADKNQCREDFRTMRFVQFKTKTGGPQHLGVQLSQDGDVYDINAVDSSIPNSLLKFLTTENDPVGKAKTLVGHASLQEFYRGFVVICLVMKNIYNTTRCQIIKITLKFLYHFLNVFKTIINRSYLQVRV